jgi:hypothetical protein
MDADAQLTQYFAGIWPHLDEHARRLVAASKAVELGYGGLSRAHVNLKPDKFHGEWNYTIHPNE